MIINVYSGFKNLYEIDIFISLLNTNEEPAMFM